MKPKINELTLTVYEFDPVLNVIKMILSDEVTMNNSWQSIFTLFYNKGFNPLYIYDRLDECGIKIGKFLIGGTIVRSYLNKGSIMLNRQTYTLIADINGFLILYGRGEE